MNDSSGGESGNEAKLTRLASSLLQGATTQAVTETAALPPNQTAAVLQKLLSRNSPDASTAALKVLQACADDSAPLRSIWEALAASPNREIRAAALDQAARLSAIRAADLLPLWLNDEDALLRRRVLSRLLLMRHPRAITAAVRCRGDADAGVRLHAVRIFTEFTQPESKPALAEFARDSDHAVRAEALQTLRRTAPFDALLAAMALHRTGPADAALDALIVLKSYTSTELIDAVDRGVAEGGAAIGPEDLAALLQHVPVEIATALRAQRNPPEWLRASLLECDARADSSNTNAMERLMSACSDPALEIRRRAVRALAARESPADFLAPLLRHRWSDVRLLAIEHLAHCGDRAARDLQNALADRDAAVRRAAYDALAEILADDAADLWQKGLVDPDAELRLHALTRLIALPADARSREALIRAAQSRDPAIRTQAISTLLERNAALPMKLARACRDTLAQLLPVDDSATANPHTARLVALVKVLAELFPAGTLELLLAAAKAKGAPIRRAAVDALLKRNRRTALTAAGELADTEDPDILKRVAIVLAEARDPRGLIPVIRAQDECAGAAKLMQGYLERFPQARNLRFLIGALKQRRPSIKRFAARELNNLDSPEMIAPLLQATTDPDVDVQRAAVQALAKFSKRPEVYQRLIEIRDSVGDEAVRQNAVANLLGIGESSVIQPLIEASKDEDVEVQFAAVQALGKFASRPEVLARLIEILSYGDVTVREKCVEIFGEYQVKEAVEPLIRMLNNPFLKFRVQEALMRIGDRKGYLAIKRFKIREERFGKKKSKGPVVPMLRKGKTGLGASERGRGKGKK